MPLPSVIKNKNRPNTNILFEDGLILALCITIPIEICIYLITLFTIVSIISLGPPLQVSLNSATIIMLAIITGKITFISSVALCIRLFPKPNLGKISNKSDMIKYAALANLSKLIRRSWTRQEFYLFPFPGNFFFFLCGTRIGTNTSINSPDSIPDPFLVEIGNHTVIGEHALISGHFRPNNLTTIIDRVVIGNNVLIGRNSSIWPGVKIGDNAVVRERSGVMPGTIIGAGEIWGGTPARNLNKKEYPQEHVETTINNFSSSKSALSEQAIFVISEFIKNSRGITMDDSNFDLCFSDSGLLDSLSFFNLIEELENHLDLRLETQNISFYQSSPKELIQLIIQAKFPDEDTRANPIGLETPMILK